MDTITESGVSFRIRHQAVKKLQLDLSLIERIGGQQRVRCALPKFGGIRPGPAHFQCHERLRQSPRLEEHAGEQSKVVVHRSGQLLVVGQRQPLRLR